MRDVVAAEVEVHGALDVARYDRAAILKRVLRRVVAWCASVEGRSLSQTRAFLREALSGPIMLTADGSTYRFTGELAVGKLLAGELGLATYVARPAGFEPATLGLEGCGSVSEAACS